jgi:hypothetical protein
MIEATERGFDLNIRREFAPLRLGKPFQHSSQMRRIDQLGLSVARRQIKNGARDFVLRLRRQPTHGFERLFQELGHLPIIAALPTYSKIRWCLVITTLSNSRRQTRLRIARHFALNSLALTIRLPPL